MCFLSNARDKAIEMFFRRNDFINKFGEIQNVDIDSLENQATVTILLHGEFTPTTLCAHYCFEDTEQGTMIVINKVDSPRMLVNPVPEMFSKTGTSRFLCGSLPTSIDTIR